MTYLVYSVARKSLVVDSYTDDTVFLYYVGSWKIVQNKLYGILNLVKNYIAYIMIL